MKVWIARDKNAGGFGDSDSCSKFKPIALKGRE